MVGKSVLNNMRRVAGQKEVSPAWNNAQRGNHQNKLTHPHPKRNFIPTTKLNKVGTDAMNAASPIKYSYFKAHSPLRRPFNQKSAAKTNNFNEKVYTAKFNNVTTAGPEVVVSTTEGKRENAVKSSACWIWRPTRKGNPQYALQDQGIFYSRCSRHMTGNKSYLIDYQDIDGGFVAFAGSPKGGKITRKGKIRTGKLDFEDVYFVKKLKFNLFSISQMCDKKNSVLFTETECLVLSPNFKLLDESQVLLKVPRHNNMYSFDQKNVVPSGGLTCLIAMSFNLMFSWVFFLATKDETSGILKTFITGIENQIDHKVKIIRCDNGNEFKNNDLNQLCGMKGIKKEFSVARTPQQNRVAKRKKRSLIEAVRNMLADSLLPTTFWAEAVNTACYVQNRVLVTKPHNKTPYELLLDRPPTIIFIRPFGCPVTIQNTLDPLGKFDGKADEGFLVGYSLNCKAFRVFNTRTRKVEENLHINFLENKPNVAGSGPEWLFDIDSLTKSMNYEPVTAGNQTNGNAGIETNVNAGQAGQEKASGHEYILLPLMFSNSPLSSRTQSIDDKDADEKEGYATSTNRDSTASSSVSTVGPSINTASKNINTENGAEADLNNLENHMNAVRFLTTRIPMDHLSSDHWRTKCSYSNMEGDQISTPKRNYSNKVIQALTDPSWIEAMQEELLQFKRQKVWTLVDLPKGKRAIRTKWVYRNKKDEREIIVRNKARLVAQGYTQEEGIDYDEVFAPVARIEAIRLFLAYASFMRLIVYQMDVKSAFLYGTIEVKVYVCQPPGFDDPQLPDKQEPITISTPKFAETQNLVVFLEKPQESTGFKEIIDFLNASSVQYALSVNPTIYTPCIEQFWTSAKLDDAEGIDCLPTATIFTELERIGFVQVFLDKQVEGMSKHKGVYVTPSHTKKVFANMKRPCKGFSGRVTPLFSTMMVQATEDMGEDSVAPSDSHSTPIISIISHPNFKMKKSKIKRGNFSGPTGACYG
ncbi:putative ribonuclease H-like domain-containing protein [Tanacetum coccineum]